MRRNVGVHQTLFLLDRSPYQSGTVHDSAGRNRSFPSATEMITKMCIELLGKRFHTNIFEQIRGYGINVYLVGTCGAHRIKFIKYGIKVILPQFSESAGSGHVMTVWPIRSVGEVALHVTSTNQMS
jgi:hypothetical protein